MKKQGVRTGSVRKRKERKKGRSEGVLLLLMHVFISVTFVWRVLGVFFFLFLVCLFLTFHIVRLIHIVHIVSHLSFHSPSIRIRIPSANTILLCRPFLLICCTEYPPPRYGVATMSEYRP